MRKTSASNGNKIKTVFSEPSCGAYVTEDDEVALPKCLVHLPSKIGSMVDIDLQQELKQRVNGGNSDYYGDDA